MQLVGEPPSANQLNPGNRCSSTVSGVPSSGALSDAAPSGRSCTPGNWAALPATTMVAMPTFAILYDYAADSDAGRDEHRPAHRAFLSGLQESGQLLLRGPYTDDAPAGALLIARADSAQELETALDGDPFWVEQLIANRTIREWSVSSPSVLD